MSMVVHGGQFGIPDDYVIMAITLVQDYFSNPCAEIVIDHKLIYGQDEPICPKCGNTMKEFVTTLQCRSCRHQYRKIFPPGG